ncbi:MAG: radical SAM protein [Myxococcales bacterium]|nr:radical SAM protein [Myxococcales bacterium]
MDVSLVLTHDCNLGCTYCYAGEKFRKAMSLEVMDRALDLGFADDAAKIQLSFFGGEPLLEWGRLVRATAEAEARAAATGKKLVLTVTTNGTLLTDERAAYLAAHGFFVGLSIDGIREAHDATRPTRGGKASFDEAERGLDLLLAHDAWFETISVVDPANVRHLGATVRWLAEKGVPRIALNPNFSAEWSDEDLAAWERGYGEAAELYVARSLADQPLYINVIEDKLITHVKGGYAADDKCSMGHGAVAVAPSGNLYPCERMVEEDRDPSLRIGDVFRGIDRGRMMCLDAQSGPVNDECGGCAVKGRCMSFCACANRAETGSIGIAGGVQCWHEQMLIRIADVAGNTLWRAKNRYFLARVYAYRDVA